MRKSSRVPDRLQKVTKLKGYIVWMFMSADGDGDCRRYEITTAILRDNDELAIDCNCAEIGDPPYVYTVVLRRKDNLAFIGEWRAGKDEDQEKGTCTCRLYCNGVRYALFGNWIEGEGKQEWCGELTPADE